MRQSRRKPRRVEVASSPPCLEASGSSTPPLSIRWRTRPRQEQQMLQHKLQLFDALNFLIRPRFPRCVCWFEVHHILRSRTCFRYLVDGTAVARRRCTFSTAAGLQQFQCWFVKVGPKSKFLGPVLACAGSGGKSLPMPCHESAKSPAMALPIHSVAWRGHFYHPQITEATWCVG